MMQMASHYPMNIHRRSNFGMYGYPPIGYPAASWAPTHHALNYHPSQNVHMNMPGASPYPHFDASRRNRGQRRANGVQRNRPQNGQRGRSGGLRQNMGAIELSFALTRGGEGGGGGFPEGNNHFPETTGGVQRTVATSQGFFPRGPSDDIGDGGGGVGEVLREGVGGFFRGLLSGLMDE